ncbi:MAG: SDR family oxidoreductase [Oscillospiraceae bacterium]|nr:SDR family oxidoreductase [Oscillospiraceae bacterium]MDD3833166.1 SDR family oxidoreductase [Oscillospiraceae bacterium]MDD4545696.1 SDR family oxidoreductase [Oscillospiraceae bacterium]
MKGLFDLSGKTALVTGSNRGIGKAILYSLAEYGADVILHCRKPGENSESVIADIRNMGRKVKGVYADLANLNSANQIYDQIVEDFKLPDIVILNASMQIRNQWTQITDDEFDSQININLRSSLKLAQLFVPHMQKNKWGRLITIGSIQQIEPNKEMLVYAATKDAVLNMVKLLAPMYAPYGVTVNNVAPGTIYTDRNKEVLANSDFHEKIINGIPVKFIGSPEDCTGTVVMLCSESSRFITGENIFIDGGKHLL